MKSHISGIQIPTASRINIDGGLTLDSQAGTSGHMLISQGAENTPIWSNTLTPSGTTIVPLTLRGILNQSGNLTEWQNNTPSTVALVTAGGSILSSANGGFGSTSALGTARLSVSAAASSIGVIVRGNATTPGDLQQWQNSGTTVLASVSALGKLTSVGLETSSGITITGNNSPLVLGSNHGTAGQVLTSQGTANTPIWTTISGGGGSGTVTSITAGTTGLTGGTITTSGTIDIDTTKVPTKSASNIFTQPQIIQPSNAGTALSLTNTGRVITINSYTFTSYYNGDEDVYVTTMNVTPIVGLESGTYQIRVRSLINQYPLVSAYYNNGVFTNENTVGYLTIYAAQPQIQFTPPALVVRSGFNNEKRFEINETGVVYLGGLGDTDPFPIQEAREGNGGYLAAGFDGQLIWKSAYFSDSTPTPIVSSVGKLAVGPTGGFTGQVLTKVNSSNYNVQWEYPKAYNVIVSGSSNGAFSFGSLSSAAAGYRKIVLQFVVGSVAGTGFSGNLVLGVNSFSTIPHTMYNTGSTTATISTSATSVPISTGVTAGNKITIEFPNWDGGTPTIYISGGSGATASQSRWGVASTSNAIDSLIITASGSMGTLTTTYTLYGVR